MKKFAQMPFFILLAVALSCNNHAADHMGRDTSINVITSFNNLFLDSSSLHQFLDEDTDFTTYSSQFRDFYRQRNYEYAWFDSGGLAEQARNFMNLLDNTLNELHDSTLYNPRLVALYRTYLNRPPGSRFPQKDSLLQTELMLTGQFFQYAAKVYKGSDIDASELGWFIPRKKIDLASLLDSVIQSRGEHPDSFALLNPQYKKMESFLPSYFALEKNTVWDSIPGPEKKFQLHDQSPILSRIKKRLYSLGDLDSRDTSNLYDTATLAAVRSFQQRMGLDVDGVIGPRFMEELNIPLTTRIRQLLVNLERVRWLPPERDSVYILVNIPEYRLDVYKNGAYLFGMNVIVGTAANNTVIFTGDLKYIVFSPYWNVPTSIVQKEILPGIQKDPGYIAKHHMEITGYSNGLPVVRQKPGTDNALGLVKFLFPNSYDIYLHDTPNHELFSQSSRGFSHGCIRIAQPTRMATFLLRSDTSWTPAKIDSAMHQPKEQWVSLRQAVPVFIVYFTAWVDQDGKLNFRKDIYGHDAALASKMFLN